jgi:hypothetical protein
MMSPEGLLARIEFLVGTGTGNGTNSARPIEKLRSCGNRMVEKRSLAKGWKLTKLLILKGLAPQAGFEPATLRLTATFFKSAGDHSRRQGPFLLGDSWVWGNP